MARPRAKRPQAPAALSPVFAHPEQHLPRIGRKDPAWRFVLACAGVGCFGVFVFASLSHGRLQPSQAEARAPRPSPEAVAPAPAPAQPPAAAPVQPPPLRPVPAMEAAQTPDPALLLDLGDVAGTDARSVLPLAGPAAAAARTPLDAGASPDERFADRVTGNSAATVHATRLPNTALIAPQGTVISAVLETALNSDLPGFASAIVSRDVRGYDNTTVLIPRGSKLIGQYKSAAQAGQSRAYVVWTRLLTPDGVSIDLGSPATDELGRGGVAGETNTHFWRRFGTSLMTSVITAGLTVAASAAAGDGGNAIILNTPATTAPVTAAMAQEANIPDTISVRQGAAIRVFVARDLDFSTVLARRSP